MTEAKSVIFTADDFGASAEVLQQKLDLLREFFMFPRKFLGCKLTRLDEVLGEDSKALEVVGKPKDLGEISGAIHRETAKAETARLVAG